MSSEKTNSEAFWKFVCGIFLSILNLFSFVFVAAKMFGWFMVPIFGLPAVTMVQAYGIYLTMAVFWSALNSGNELYLRSILNFEKMKNDALTYVCGKLVVVWFVFLIGYFVSYFV